MRAKLTLLLMNYMPTITRNPIKTGISTPKASMEAVLFVARSYRLHPTDYQQKNNGFIFEKLAVYYNNMKLFNILKK